MFKNLLKSLKETIEDSIEESLEQIIAISPIREVADGWAGLGGGTYRGIHKVPSILFYI